MKIHLFLISGIVMLIFAGILLGEPQRLEAQQTPKLISMVQPVYPPEAKKDRIQGKVILEACIDEKGNVTDVKVISIDSPDCLKQAAMDAVKQWKYKPYKGKDGKAIPVKATVTIKFTLDDDADKRAGTPALLAVDSEKLVILKKVEPVYPAKAKADRIQGKVLLEAVINEQGDVTDLKVVSEKTPPSLNNAAMEAVKQWKFKPFKGKDGKVVSVKTTIDVTFSLY